MLCNVVECSIIYVRGDCMFLKQTKLKGRIYLQIVKGYRDNGNPKQKVIKKCGYLDELEKSINDPIAYFKAEAERLTELEKIQPTMTISPDFNEITPDEFDESKNLGYAFLQKIYYDLKLHNFFANKQRQSNIQYNMNNVIRLLTFSRILYPDSKKSTFESRDVYFERFTDTLDSLFDCLTRVSPWQEELQKFLYESVTSLYGKGDQRAYFDCTNYYFEIDEEDEFRKNGPSKEHRKSPIVQMGLLMDSRGFPMAYHVFPGNESEKKHLLPVINRCQRDYNLERVIVVADKALNTSDNIFYTQGKHNGYVYSQTIRGADEEFKNWVTKDEGYSSNPNYRDKIKDEDCHDLHDIYKLKSRVIGKTIRIKDENGNRTHEVTVKQKQIVYYSPKFKARAEKKREQAIAKALKMIDNPGMYASSTKFGSNQYIRTYLTDPTTGEKTEAQALSKKARKAIEKLRKEYEKNPSEDNDYTKLIQSLDLSLDNDLIEEQKKYDGYYSVVTSEYEKSDEEILKIYRGLWKIEESFKITKSEFNTRPFHLTRKDRIESHFFICFLSLLILRIIEHETNREYSPAQLIESMKAFKYTRIGENVYQCLYRDKVISMLDKELHLDTSHKYMHLADIKKILAEAKK